MTAFTIPLPRYQCHKQVSALKIKAVVPNPRGVELHFDDERFCPHQVELFWVTQHGAEAGGYFVVYADGYTSYSPAAAFEAGYTLLEEGSDRAWSAFAYEWPGGPAEVDAALASRDAEIERLRHASDAALLLRNALENAKGAALAGRHLDLSEIDEALRPIGQSTQRFAAIIGTPHPTQAAEIGEILSAGLASHAAEQPPAAMIVDVSAIDKDALAEAMKRARPVLVASQEPTLVDRINDLTNDRLTAHKAGHICERDGYAVTGVILTKDDGRACLVNMSAVRWLGGVRDLWNLMHTDSLDNVRMVAEAVATERAACEKLADQLYADARADEIAAAIRARGAK